MNAQDEIVRLVDCTHSFKQLRVFSEVNASLYRGEVLGLVGPNGGGKSTLLRVIAGLIRPTRGEVRLLGESTETLALSHAGSVGLITAEAGLYPLLTGRENLHFFGELYGLSRAEIDQRAAPILAALGLTVEMARRVSGYSSGMRQKLSLARALLLKPKLLLLDEPTANLDPISAWALHEQVRAQASAGVTVLLCTHDLQAAQTWCDRVWIFNRGLVGEFCQPSPAPVESALLRYMKEVL